VDATAKEKEKVVELNKKSQKDEFHIPRAYFEHLIILRI